MHPDKLNTPPLILIVLFSIIPIMNQAQPIILSLSLDNSIVEIHGRFQANIDLIATYSNPYNYEEVKVNCTFTGPDNRKFLVDGFYMEDFILDSQGNLSQNGAGFKLRFSPPSIGTWSYQVSVGDSNGLTIHPPDSFEVVASTNSQTKGYVRIGNTNYLELDSGEQYIPIGENICWHNDNPYLDYKTWLDSLSSNGGNFFRLWHAHWGLGIEWKNNWEGYGGLLQYQQEHSKYQDWLFEYCREKGIYVMLCLQHHGPVSTQVNPNWDDNPYNAANGGPCQTTADFFSNEEAIRITKNRFRYILARWGYSQSVMAWELFNEVEWTDDYDAIQQEVMLWHAEMAAFIKATDPYQHLVTTSFAKEENDPLIWGITDLDFTQTHHYLGAANLERVLAEGIHRYLEDYGKPTLTGEFGNGLSNNLEVADPDGIHIHNGMWGSLMAGGLGTAMSWWWDIYLHPQDLYYHFFPIRRVVDRIPFAEKNMAPAALSVSGNAGDLDLTPTGDWAVIGIDSVQINSDGSVLPTNPNLAIYLYGSEVNTDFRSPPVFTVDYPIDGEFTVHTASTKGSLPRIAIWVDGIEVLDESADINESFTVSISAGPHSIRVDNPGFDWITISAYTFSGLGTATDLYALISESGDVAAGWILNNDYNYLTVPLEGPPTPVTEATLNISGMQDSSYYLKWYDCLTGAIIGNEAVTVINGEATVDIPWMIWDLAFIIDGIAESVEDSSLANLEFEAYPNPARRGETATIVLPATSAPSADIELLDMTGRPVLSLAQSGKRSYEVTVPAEIAAGMYWWRVRSGSLIGTKAMFVPE